MSAFIVRLVAPRLYFVLRSFVPHLVATCILTPFSCAAPPPIVLTGPDRPPPTSLNGELASIVDPYFSGLFSFHHEEKKNGYFMNYKAKPGDAFPTESDYSRAPKLNVPGDW